MWEKSRQYYFTTYLFYCQIIQIFSQQIYQSSFELHNVGTTFIPRVSFEFPLKNLTIKSLKLCAQQCNQHILCRIFVYDKVTLNCQLYQSDLSCGNITLSQASTSRVGRIRYQSQLYLDYNKTCNRCQVNRYLTCQNAKCLCPPPTTFWDGQMCQNQMSYGQTCNSSIWCRQDWNLTCIFGSCQPNTAICKMGAAAITFDDLPDQNNLNGLISSVYHNISWTNAKYLNATGYVNTGYSYARSSGEIVSWFNNPMTIQAAIANTVFTLNSFVMAAGWSNSISITIVGYFSSTQLYSTSIAINTYTKQVLELNWSGLTKVIFTPSGSGYFDTGMDNLCITF